MTPYRAWVLCFGGFAFTASRCGPAATAINRLLLLLPLATLAAVPARAQRATADAQASFAALSDGLAFVENRGPAQTLSP